VSDRARGHERSTAIAGGPSLAILPTSREDRLVDAAPDGADSSVTASDTLDRLAVWLAEVSAEAALAGNGSG
jgi:hypothetical protein